MKKQILNTKYYITDCGKVINGNTEQVLKPKLTRQGYVEINLREKSKLFCFRIHRLVATAFISNPDNKPFVNHIDGNKQNNHVSNLEWVTHQENMDHASNTGLCKRGEDCHSSIYDEETIRKVCELLEQGKRNSDIAKILNVKKQLPSQIRSGSGWKHISKDYNIPDRSRSLSDSTIRWICEKIVEGLTQSQILEISKNPRITKTMIKDIRRKRIYRDISKEYF